MSPAFYQKFWHIVGNDVIKTVQNFFTTGCLPVNLNDTNVVLIPKKKKPELITEMRPISLCNVLYKVISKVLTNRMKHLMGSIISENQSAFIPGRLITDNIMISFEVLHYLKRRQQGKDGVMALKLDLSKAFDRIEWAYLNAMLLKLGLMKASATLIVNLKLEVGYVVVKIYGVPPTVSHAPFLTAVPSPLCNQMETLMNRFWWQSKGENSKEFIGRAGKISAKCKSKGGMGFRNLRTSIWLLGKPGLAPLVNHNSLVGRIFKARHFPNTSFFNSGDRWKPKLHLHEVFLKLKSTPALAAEKLCWMRAYVSILNDPWLPAEMDGFIHSSHPALLHQAVSSLLQQDVKDWDIDILNDLFNDRDKDLILQLQLSPTAFEDSWYWLNDRADVSIDTTCSSCQSNQETSLHLFVNCPFAQNCLRKALGSARGSIEQSFAAWFQHGLSNWSSSDIESISMLCWALWRCRNDFIWNNTQPSVNKVISSAKLTLDQWKSAQSLTKTLSNNCTSHQKVLEFGLNQHTL
uniref:Reverse transcriptase domain-containing protein n=1 Tax=Cannabis sativa TaxID=3483 RepID=A0A803PJN1_CANSA